MAFWDQTTNEPHVKHVSNLKHLVAAGDYCAVVFSEKIASSWGPTHPSDAGEGGSSGGSSSGATAASEVFHIQLRNAIGAVIDTKRVAFSPKYVCIGTFYFAAMNDRTVYMWQFQSQVAKSGLGSTVDNEIAPTSGSSSSGSSNKSKERMFDIESIHVASAQPPETFRIQSESINDPITCCAISDKFLVIGRKVLFSLCIVSLPLFRRVFVV